MNLLIGLFFIANVLMNERVWIWLLLEEFEQWRQLVDRLFERVLDLTIGSQVFAAVDH